MLLLETLLWKNSCPSLQARVIVDKPSAERGSNNKQKKKKKKRNNTMRSWLKMRRPKALSTNRHLAHLSRCTVHPSGTGAISAHSAT